MVYIISPQIAIGKRIFLQKQDELAVVHFPSRVLVLVPVLVSAGCTRFGDRVSVLVLML